jgi:catechol-2,3-dioxygenase
MALHRLTGVVLGVPNVEEAAEFYTTYGLIPEASSDPSERYFGTPDGGPRQLHLVEAPVRTTIALGIGVDEPDDLARIKASLEAVGAAAALDDDQVTATEPVTGLQVVITVAPRVAPRPEPEPHEPNVRAAAVLRTEPARPRKFGHLMIGSVDPETTRRFFLDGIGFKLSDTVQGAATFMRCSTDHHNVVVAPARANYLHHTAWEMTDIDEIERAASVTLDGHSDRQVWGPGRNWVGSNYFHIVRDPAGNFCEYYSDMDEITDDGRWEPGVHKIGAVWAPPIPHELIEPEDVAALVADAG